jgi:hypothetical protein
MNANVRSGVIRILVGLTLALPAVPALAMSHGGGGGGGGFHGGGFSSGGFHGGGFRAADPTAVASAVVAVDSTAAVSACRVPSASLVGLPRRGARSGHPRSRTALLSACRTRLAALACRMR